MVNVVEEMLLLMRKDTFIVSLLCSINVDGYLSMIMTDPGAFYIMTTEEATTPPIRNLLLLLLLLLRPY